jgi:ADP-heptose:LPS heptosyltransferase
MLRRNVLIFHQAALGDFIVTWPLALAMSRIMPQSRIIYVTHSQKGALAERVLRVESTDAEAGWHNLFVAPPDAPQLPEKPARLLEGAQVILSFTAGTEDNLADGLMRAAPHVKVISLDTKRTSSGHVTQSLLEQLHDSKVLSEALDQMLRSVASRGVGYRLNPSDQIVVHPGAGKEANRWPGEKFLELAQKCREGAKRLRIVLGEVEIERWPGELIGQFEQVAEVIRPITLLDLCDQIAAANVFVGNDSGPAHLAGIIGVPTVALFGPSDPVRWRPLGPKVSLLHRDPISQITVEDVYTEVQRLLGG